MLAPPHAPQQPLQRSFSNGREERPRTYMALISAAAASTTSTTTIASHRAAAPWRLRATALVALVACTLGTTAAAASSPFRSSSSSASDPLAVAHEPLLAPERLLADDSDGGSSLCHDSASFLGVGNTRCLNENIGTAVFLLGIIVVVSIAFDRVIHYVRRAIECPQLRKIVNRIFQEIMIMGFISMVIFTLNTSGAMKRMNFASDALSPTEQLHFYEFFHYIVFLTMIYFILIVLLLLFIGTVVPKLIWAKHARRADDMDGDYDSDDSFHRNAPHSDDELFDDTRCRGVYDSNDMDANRTVDESDGCVVRGDLHSSSRAFGARASALRRAKSGMDMVQGSRAYSLLLERYEREGWCFRFHVVKQWHLWKSFEILAYNICQHRSGYIYKNPDEMHRLFDVKPPVQQPHAALWLQRAEARSAAAPMTYVRYHELCMRNLLFHISDLHVSALVILVVISVLPSLYPTYDHWIFIGVGAALLVANVVIFAKVLAILRGIVDDRLRVISMRDIRARLAKSLSDADLHRTSDPDARATATGVGAQTDEHESAATGSTSTATPPARRKRLRLKTVALSVRAVIRMQMSALCHRQLHYHDDRFWFNSPQLLLRMFQFATISQAFYLVWLSLVAAPTILQSDEAYYLLPIMVLLPFIALCIITPMTMPSLVLVMSLTGIFVDLNSSDTSSRGRSGKHESYNVAKTRIRLMRRSFLKSHYTDVDDGLRSPAPHVPDSSSTIGGAHETVTSPTSVFLRIYDSPTAAAVHGRLASEVLASPTNAMTLRGGGSIGRSNGGGSIGRSNGGGSIGRSNGGGSIGRSNGGSLGRSGGRDDSGYSGPRRSFNLAAFHASMNPSVLSTVYHSPRTDSSSGSHGNPSSGGAPASANWSQALVEPQSVSKKPTVAAAAAAGAGRTVSNQDDSSALADPTPSPASESFKRYCSKYGGYPDQ